MNVILVIFDSLRKDALGPMGHRRGGPWLRRIWMPLLQRPSA